MFSQQGQQDRRANKIGNTAEKATKANLAEKATKDAALAEMPTCIDRLRREYLSADIEIYDTAVKVFEAQVAALAAANHQ